MRQRNAPRRLLEELVEQAISDHCTRSKSTKQPGALITRLSPERRQLLADLTAADFNSVRTDWFSQFTTRKMLPRR